MSNRLLKLLLIDQDPIFRLGLRVALEDIPSLQVVSEAESDTAALKILAELAQKDPDQVNLVVLELGNGRSTLSQQLGLQLCRHLKTQYPNLPVLLLSSVQDQGILLAVKAAGVDGYCTKGTPVSQLVTAMQEVAAGGCYWGEEVGGLGTREQGAQGGISPLSSPSTLSPSSPIPLAGLRNRLRLSGINYINTALAEVTAQLQVLGLRPLEQAILAGQRRELLAARWFLNRLLSSPLERQQFRETNSRKVSQKNNFTSLQLQDTANSPLGRSVSQTNSSERLKFSPLLSPRALQAELFASCITKLQFPLENLTDVALEIDILRVEKKRELLYLVLQKIADALDEIRNSEVELTQLRELKNTLLIDIWQETITHFFGKFYRIQLDNNNIEIVNLFLQNAINIQTEILNKLPLVEELFSYLLFQSSLQIENVSYPAGSSEAKEHAEMLLENLLIQMANSVIQPLLDSLADVEVIKQSFYDRKLISTREIARFRNNLSWKYRLRNYMTEPRAIFESRYELFVFAPRGIAKTSIYAPRGQELAKLSGIPLVVTLALEFRDAITPRLQSLLSFLGSGVVFILTQIIGRGIGLVARGIIQGIGSVSLSEKKNKNL